MIIFSSVEFLLTQNANPLILEAMLLNSVNVFKRKLKTQLFNIAYPI